MKFQIVLGSSDEGGYTAFVPRLPGCISEGNNREEALENMGLQQNLWVKI